MQRPPRISTAVNRTLNPFLPGLDPGPSSLSVDGQTPLHTSQGPGVRIDGTAARRPRSELSPASVLLAGGDKGPSGRRIPTWSWLSPPLGEPALGTPAMPDGGTPAAPGDKTARIPEDPGRAGCGAKGRATLGTARPGMLARRHQGAILAPRSSLGCGFTCARLTTAVQLVPSPAPAAPPLPAALMETQPEPLASAAPAATGPAQATAATPLTTASATPPATGARLFIG